jgi:peptide deformylase
MVSLYDKIVNVCYILHYTCMEIFTLGNEVLHQKAAPVENIKDNSHKWSEVLQGMFDALTKGKGVGLAGPQVGLMEQVFVTNVEGDVPRVFINPSIIETSQETVKYEEGCLSIPGIYVDVIRPKTVKVQAWNEKGRPFTLEAGGLLARVILHEYDHLEGILFIDRLSEPKRKKIIDKFAKKAKA